MGGPVDVGVPVAYEYAGVDARGRDCFEPVEARPCGDRLVVPDHDIDLSCDLPEGHQSGVHWKHRAILSHAQGHHVNWCDGECSNPCAYVTLAVLPFLQRVRRSHP